MFLLTLDGCLSFVHFLLASVLSVFLTFSASGYPVNILKHFLYVYIDYKGSLKISKGLLEAVNA